MLRKLLLVSFLCISLTALAQYSTPVVPVVAATPGITYASPQPTAGISNAGRAGISDTAPATLITPLNSSTVVYVSDTAANPAVAAAPASASVAPATESTAAPANIDYGGSFYSDTLAASPNNGPSLGEIAVNYRTHKGSQTARTYTNADIQKLGGNRISLGNGGNGLSSNRQISLPGLMAQNSQPPTIAAAQNTAPPATADQGSTAPATGNNAQAAPASTPTTPEINRQQAQPENQNENGRLPASAGLLPLLGLLGLASAGIGLLVRRWRRWS